MIALQILSLVYELVTDVLAGAHVTVELSVQFIGLLPVWGNRNQPDKRLHDRPEDPCVTARN